MVVAVTVATAEPLGAQNVGDAHGMCPYPGPEPDAVVTDVTPGYDAGRDAKGRAGKTDRVIEIILTGTGSPMVDPNQAGPPRS